MSLILDALRKMEQERRSKRGTAQDLRPDVLRYHSAGGTAPKQPARYPLVIIGLVLLCAGIGAGVLLKGNRGEVVPQGGEAPAPIATAPAANPLLADAPAPAAIPAPVPVLPGEPVAGSVAVERPREKQVRAPVAPPPRPAPFEAMPQPLHESVGEMQAGMPEITISGIAYQDERRMRRAVLNGVLVGEGAEIAGARVIEIRETKVRMSRGGRIFEIPFSSGFPSH